MAYAVEGLGQVLQAQGKHLRTESAYREALEIRQSVYDADHSKIVELRSNFFSLSESTGRPEQAAKHRRAEASRPTTAGRRPKMSSNVNEP